MASSLREKLAEISEQPHKEDIAKGLASVGGAAGGGALMTKLLPVSGQFAQKNPVLRGALYAGGLSTGGLGVRALVDRMREARSNQSMPKTAAKDPYQFPPTWGTKDRKTGQITPFSGTAAQEVEMWRTWKESGEDPDQLQPLLQSLNPVIQRRVLRHKAPRILPSVIEAEARTLTVKALRRYNPAKGTQISTHVENNLKGLNRFVKQHQNFTRIVETQANKIGDFQRAKEALEFELGREPTTLELADKLSMSAKKVERLELELRRDVFSALPSDDLIDANPFEQELPVHREIIEMLPYELTLDEQKVFNYLFGRGGVRKETSTGKIAKKLGWSDSKVSQLKKSISKKFRDYEESF